MGIHLLWTDEPVSVVETDGVDAEEIDEWNSKYPAIVEEIAGRNHRQRHINIGEDI